MADQTKSVHLYSKPTHYKKELVWNTQKAYSDLINHFIQIMTFDSSYYLDLFNNQKQSPLVRSLEKRERKHHSLGSAFGQNAIDHAVKELHNHFNRIKNKLFGFCTHQQRGILPYVSSIALLNASLLDLDELLILQGLLQKEKGTTEKSKEKEEFYHQLIQEISALSVEQREEKRSEVRTMFYEKLEHWKLPLVKLVPLQLDSRLYTIEKARHIKADFVISVKLLGCKKRVEIPLSTSSSSLRRLAQYPNGSPILCLKGNQVRVSVPFEKKVNLQKTKGVLGVDAGITDLLFTSNGKTYGSFSGMRAFYEEVLEPKLKQRSKIRAKMKQYQKRLKKTSCSSQKEWLRGKISRWAAMLNGEKNLQTCQRKYAHRVEAELGRAIKPFVQDVNKIKMLVAMESLDLSEFDRGKQNNKRDSSWVRGQLLKKTKEQLKWAGIPFVEVDPAYTSQACPICDYIDRANRQGKLFVCTVCKHQADADHNASINIANRALDEKITQVSIQFAYSTKKRHEAIKEIYSERHRSYLESCLLTA